MTEKDYGGVIWTNHAIERLEQRGIKQGDAYATFMRPDESRPGNKRGTYVYYKTWKYVGRNGRERCEQIEVVATKEGGRWIILSVWSKPVRRHRRRKGGSKSIWKKIISIFMG